MHSSAAMRAGGLAEVAKMQSTAPVAGFEFGRRLPIPPDMNRRDDSALWQQLSAETVADIPGVQDTRAGVFASEMSPCPRTPWRDEHQTSRDASRMSLMRSPGRGQSRRSTRGGDMLISPVAFCPGSLPQSASASALTPPKTRRVLFGGSPSQLPIISGSPSPKCETMAAGSWLQGAMCWEYPVTKQQQHDHLVKENKWLWDERAQLLKKVEALEARSGNKPLERAANGQASRNEELEVVRADREKMRCDGNVFTTAQTAQSKAEETPVEPQLQAEYRVEGADKESLQARKEKTMTKLRLVVQKVEDAWNFGMNMASAVSPAATSHRTPVPMRQKPTVKVTFVVNYVSQPGQDLFLIGSHAELGQWCPLNAVAMRWGAGHNWSVMVEFPLDAPPVQYKYLLKQQGGVVWEDGLNHTVMVLSRRFSDEVRQDDVWGHGIS